MNDQPAHDQPPRWQGWRRPRGSHAGWQAVTDALAASRGACYALLMRLSELAGGEGGPWEYQVLPEGRGPWQGSFQSRAYSTKDLKPRRW